MTKSYIIADVTITDPERYADYRKLSGPSLVPYDGRFIIRGGERITLEGEWQSTRLVVIEFPSREKAMAWWSSDDYAPAKAIRQAASVTNLVFAEGYDEA